MIEVAYPYYNVGSSPKRFLLEEDDFITHSIRTARMWEFRFLCDLYRQAASRVQAPAFLDVGAHLGTTSVLAADFFSGLHCFELDDENYALLKKNLELNGIDAQTYNVGVADYSGTAPYYRSASNKGGHSLASLVGAKAERQKTIITLDSLDAGIDSVAFVHIDVEGYDFRVLNGAYAFIERQKVRPFVEFEFQPWLLAAAGTDATDLLRFVRRFGYGICMNASNVLASLPQGSVIELFDHWKNTRAWIDLYLVPPSKPEAAR